MGEKISQNWRVLTATLFSVILVAGAFVLARGIESPQVAEASTESALLQAIATKDVDSDGLPDWEESLYGTSPSTTDTLHLGMTDGEAVAKGLIVPKAIADIAIATSSGQSTDAGSAEGTLTDAFAKSFFTLYMSAKQASGGVQLSQLQIDDLSAQALSSLSSMVVATPDYKSIEDLSVSGSGAEALKAFAASAEAVISQNNKATSATKNEIFYLQDVVEKGDTTAFPHLISIAKMYRDTAVGLATLPVPTELATADLALINEMMRSSQIVSDFARVNTDPLAAMLALNQYTEVTIIVNQTLIDLSTVYATARVTIPIGAPGANFLESLDQYHTAVGSNQAL